ncbi:MAG TPA: glycosyltransferase [Pyrinomonadaceae bacterium]|jgi:glycosyltransferase involved in cell wall biosynthesis
MRHRVLQLISGFWEGGSERQAVQLTRLLLESGRYHVEVACLYGGGPLRAEVERLGFKDIPEFPLNSFYDRNAFVQLARFRRFLREREIDVVHAHEFYTNIFGMTGASLARTPVRIASRRETTGTRTPLQKRVERGAYKLAGAIVANAGAVREQLIVEGVGAKKIEVIHNGLDASRVAPDPSMSRADALAACGLPRDVEGRRFVTIVANLRLEVKDHPTFLRAARRVREAVPEAAFVLAGEGELTERLRSLAAELGLGERDVFFTGRCERIAELLAASDVCVLSSKAEGFSNAILEYMAAGRPVVATDVGGARETVVEGETGYLVAAGDDEALATRIVELLKDTKRAREMGERGRLIVEEKFSCAAQLERTEKLYERLLASAVASVAHEIKGVRREDVS